MIQWCVVVTSLDEQYSAIVTVKCNVQCYSSFENPLILFSLFNYSVLLYDTVHPLIIL
jgi:hypothetical protein